MINQLFIEKPPVSLILECIILLGWTCFTDKRVLSRSQLDEQQIPQKFTNMLNRLRQYYLPCKQAKYLINATTKSIITIIRQLLKTIGYNIRGIERVIENKKEMIYKLEPYNKSYTHIQRNNHIISPVQNNGIILPTQLTKPNNVITTHTSQNKFIVCWN